MAATVEAVREAVQSTVADVIEAFKDQPETERATVIERLDTECDTLFGQLVMAARLADYTLRDCVSTAESCAAIIEVAEEDAWLEEDAGLWEGLTYGVLASIAFFSLRNLLYHGLEQAGHDSNEERPFAAEEVS